MASVPIVENISEHAATMKVRHAGRSDPFGVKARKGLKHGYLMGRGKRPVRRTPKRAH